MNPTAGEPFPHYWASPHWWFFVLFCFVFMTCWFLEARLQPRPFRGSYPCPPCDVANTWACSWSTQTRASCLQCKRHSSECILLPGQGMQQSWNASCLQLLFSQRTPPESSTWLPRYATRGMLTMEHMSLRMILCSDSPLKTHL